MLWQKSVCECSYPGSAFGLCPVLQATESLLRGVWNLTRDFRLGHTLVHNWKTEQSLFWRLSHSSELGACSHLSFIAKGYPWMRIQPLVPSLSLFTLYPLRLSFYDLMNKLWQSTNTRTMFGPPWISPLPVSSRLLYFPRKALLLYLALASPLSFCSSSAASVGSFKMDVSWGPFQILYCLSPWFP